MASYNDIIKSRKRRKIKKKIKNTTWVIIFFAVLVATTLIWVYADENDIENKFKNWQVSNRSGNGFPIVLDDMKVENLLVMGEDVAVVTHGGNYIYNSNGAKLLVDLNVYSYPLTAQTDGKLLVYDVGGKSYHITTKSEVILSNIRDNRMLAADICSTGGFAIAEESKGYLGQVTVFDVQGREVYNWQTTVGYIYLMELWADGRGFAVASSNAVDGVLYTSINFNFIYENKDSVSWSLTDEIVLSMTWTENETLRVVTSKNIRSYDKYGKELFIVPVPEGMTGFENHSDGNLYLVCGDYHSADGVYIKAYDATLRNIGTLNLIGEEVLEVKQDGDRVLVLTESNLYLADKNLNQMKERKADGLTHIALAGSQFYGIGAHGLILEGL